VAAAARAAAFPAVSLVDVFTDDTYARSSLKLVGETGPLLQAARLAALEAVRLIDLQNEPHPAPHPRCGAVDMVAFMPLSEASATDLAPELRTCEDLATQLGVSLGDAGCSVLLYGPQRGRTLLEARRHTSFFKSVRADAPNRVCLHVPPDAGPAEPSQRVGVSVVGAMTYVTNFNVQIESASLTECKAAATALRTAMGVQVMALPHAHDSVEIGCNLQASTELPSPNTVSVLQLIRDNLPVRAHVRRAYVVGLTPAAALDAAAAS